MIFDDSGGKFRNTPKKAFGDKTRAIEDSESEIVCQFVAAEENGNIKIFPSSSFGYHRIQINRPLRLNFQASEERLAKLYQNRSKTSEWHHAENVPPEHRPLAGSLTPEQAHAAILELRAFHRALDQAVLTAYVWHQPGPDGPAIELGHDFQQVETLPENDRTRYTITPQARKDLLARLLKLNHQRAAEEAASQAVQTLTTKGIKSKKAQRAKQEDELL